LRRIRYLKTGFLRQGHAAIAILCLVAITAHFVMRFGFRLGDPASNAPLLVATAIGGLPLLYDLLRKFLKREYGSDLLGGISILVSIWLGEYLAGSIIVLMLAGGAALERYALRSASSVLDALARRVPLIAHRRAGSAIEDVALDAIAIGDVLAVYPHEICPVDGEVIDGHGVMDESYLTGEPFEITKTRGSQVISGAINGGALLTITAVRRAADSRYARIMNVMRDSERERPQMRRLGDRLGAVYTPVALAIAAAAWIASGDPMRFLAVLVIATPCPLLIAIPVAIVGSISLCARRALIVKSPIVLEQIGTCRTAIFDKTGTLTFGTPSLTEVMTVAGITRSHVLQLVGSLERYSKHPLARAVLAAAAAEGIALADASEVNEPPGEGLRGAVLGHPVIVTSRKRVHALDPTADTLMPATAGGLECAVVIDHRYAATLCFRDAPRPDSRSFIQHLAPKHQFARTMIVSGDRASEVDYLAREVGVTEVFAGQSPEQKLALVRKETALAPTLYVGDGINDAPAMMAATVGMAIGEHSDVTAEAAGVVALENSLRKVDEFIHISRRLRTIVLQSAVGGMALSMAGMGVAAAGYLTPVNGAMLQEAIDVLAVLNALRAAFPPSTMHDF
jgi:heavy metal translocating P-type ATPase